ncbi:MAG: trigger factor [Candidatus Omnitrophica bacterium]|nr:trigger factor [Candidatus Omnitrophota bacterium]MBU4477745.1 trigger factor [Candidatus Omnitrophota bacterium]MCG2703037.1 trigger factor [Candidatus Omnitrophota bacterium]
MKVNVKESARCQRILEIEVSKETIQEEFDRFYSEIRKTAEVPGFRKGKAPRELLERHFSAKAKDNVLTNLLSDSYRQAVEQEKICPVTMPSISEVNFEKNEKLTFQAKVDVRPLIALKEYKSIKIKKQTLTVKEEEINNVLNFLRERYAQFRPAESRPAKIGDYVICDYRYSVEDKEIDKKEHIWMQIDKEMFIPGLSAELTGINAGENKEFSLKLPKDFKPSELANKTARFNVSIKEIKEKELPELNDAFAKMIVLDTLELLKQHVKEDIEKEKESRIKLDIKAQLTDYLVKTMPIDVPPMLTEKREQSLRESFRNRLRQEGMPAERIEEEEKKMGDLFNPEAVKQIRMFFILQEIGEKENVRVEEQELNQRIELIAQSYGKKKEELVKYLQDKDLIENVHWEIWEEKVISFLLEHAETEEVPAK